MTVEQFEQAIRDFGIEAACNYFGYKQGDLFIEKMKQKLAPIPIEPEQPEPMPEPIQNTILDLSRFQDYIQVWTAGMGSGNGKEPVGGYGVLLVYKGKEKPLWGFTENVTSQRMQLVAVVSGLEGVINKDLPVVVFSESDFIIQAIKEKWFEQWQKNNWKTESGDPVMDQDLWQKLLQFYYDYIVNEVNLKFVHISDDSVKFYIEQAKVLAKKGVDMGNKNPIAKRVGV